MDLITRIQEGHTHLVTEFLRLGNGAQTGDKNGVSLMQWCAYHGDVTAIEVLLERGASLNDLGKNFDLNGAVFHGHVRLTEFLLEAGADPNFPLEDTGETPLHAALCKSGDPAYTEIVRDLLGRGANPSAITKPRVETGAFMRDVFTRAETPLHRAAAYGDATCIRLLLDAGADKTRRDMNGDSPLSWASWHLRPPKILALLCFGDYSIHPDRLREDR
mgnify:CR=1 FL=1